MTSFKNDLLNTNYFNAKDMNDEKLLNNLLYCSKCFTHIENSSSPFYIGECMHIICSSCFKNTTKCSICSSTAKFIVLTTEFSMKLLKNPSMMFNEPVEASMFQLNASLSLIVRQKKEINRLKAYLKKAKDELIKIRGNQEQTEKKSLFNFDNRETEPRQAIEKIYGKNNISNNSNLPRKNNYLNDLTNRAVEKKFFTDYKQNEMSLSSSRSSRLTIPKKENEFKYIYRKHNQF